MTVEAAATIDQLNVSLPNSTDSLAEGASHLRLIKSALKGSFPGLTGVLTLTTALVSVIQAAFQGRVSIDLSPPAGALAAQGAGIYLQKGTAAGSLDVLVANYANTGQLYVVTPGGGTGGTTLYTGINVNQFGALNIVGPSPDLQFNGLSYAQRFVPSGVITLWYGSAATVPTGWAICNGTAGTPDLRDRFVVGAGLTFAPTQTGGASTATGTTNTAGFHTHTGVTYNAGGHTPSGSIDVQGAHSHGGSDGGHTLTVAEIPPHTHVVDAGYGTGSTPYLVSNAAYAGQAGASQTEFIGGGAAHSHSISTDGAHAHNLFMAAVPDHGHAIAGDGAHTHSLTVATVPPFQALLYIMKL